MIELYISILPVFLVAYYIYNKDKDKEPIKLLIKLLLGGVCSCFVVIVISGIFDMIFPIFNITDTTTLNISQRFLYAFLGVAIIEETCKFFFLHLFSYNHKEFDTLFDMIVYSVFVSLGFAAFENIFYVLEGGILTGLLRAVTAIPLHSCAGVFMGIFLGKAKLLKINNTSGSLKNKILAILVPTLMHGIYDFFAFTGTIFSLLVLIFIVVVFIIVTLTYINKKYKNDIIIKFKNNFCSNCGEKVIGPYCSNCGNKTY